ncbi:MAG: D-glycerate dehydrogenase [Chloroflexi bacterium]|nr:D-glycerate dehydrogenase [Chloroflexota bacterium]
MPDVLITRRTFPAVLDLFERAGLTVDHNAADTPLSRAELAARLQGARALMPLLTDRVDAALLDAAPSLEIVANVAVGYDNVDVGAATARGIVVSNTPGVLTEATADLTMALLLAAARRLPEADAYTRAGRYQGWELFQPHLGLDVSGQTLGIAGMGRIGSAVARRAALGFNMPILYTSRSPVPAVEAELGARRVDLDTLLRESDFVSLHLPLTPETRHLIGAAQLALMKPTAILINTARGPIVDEAALVAALESGAIAGAALDVYEEEPAVHPGLPALHQHVVLAPHIGSATTRTRERMSLTAAANIVAVLGGGKAPNAVN